MDVRRTILVAKGVPVLLAALELALAHNGDRYLVLSAPSAASALLQLQVVKPEVIIVGIEPGETEGWETLRRIRALSTAPIIVFSAEDRPEITIRSIEQGADYCIFLPLDVPALRSRLQALLQREVALPAASP